MSNKNLYSTFASQISDYVQAHLSEEIVLDDLAELVGLSKFHLNRLFHATTGFQLGEFIQRRRLQKAYSLLSAGDCSVIEVSLAVGYESHSSFSRTFLKSFGCKPSDVKKGSEPLWKTPNTLKNNCESDSSLQPELFDFPERSLRGLYGSGFSNNSFLHLGLELFSEVKQQLQTSNIDIDQLPYIGVSLDSPWQVDPQQCRFFAGFDLTHLGSDIELAEYIWTAGTWVRFYHRGAYASMWQTISRIYAGWVIPENISLKDQAIVQVFLNHPMKTPEADLCTALYFPIQN